MLPLLLVLAVFIIPYRPGEPGARELDPEVFII